MKNTLNNPMRYKTISEMSDWEIWYISEDSLCFDIQEQTGETIYALFHYHPYSKTQNEENNDDVEIYDIQIKCHIINNERYFQIFNPINKIKHDDLETIPKRLYTILEIEKEYIKKLNAKKENIDTKELSDAFSEFIEYILENMEEEEDKDEAYWQAWTNFSFAITDICHSENRENIEHILYNTYNTIINTLDGKDIILEWFSDYNSATDYMIQQLEEEKFDGFIETEIWNKIENISSCFHELFYIEEDNFQSEPIGEENQKPEKSIKELQIELQKALKDFNYEKAAELRDQIKELWWNTKE